MKKTLILTGILVAVVIAFTTCKNFMSSGDDDFKQKIEDDVRIAGEPNVNIYVSAAPGTGSTTPNGPYTAKRTVSFNVLYDPANSYGFIQWAAFDGNLSDTQYAGMSLTQRREAALGPDMIVFSDPVSRQTTAAVMTTAPVLIRPISKTGP